MRVLSTLPRKLRKNYVLLSALVSERQYFRAWMYLVSCHPIASVVWAMGCAAWPFASGTRGAFAVLLVALVLNKEVNTALKKLIVQPRPAGSGKATHGMPSCHSQASFLVASFLWMLPGIAVVHNAWVAGLLAVGVATSRVVLGVHTPDQVIVGAAVGVVLGVLTAQAALVLTPPTL